MASASSVAETGLRPAVPIVIGDRDIADPKRVVVTGRRLAPGRSVGIQVREMKRHLFFALRATDNNLALLLHGRVYQPDSANKKRNLALLRVFDRVRAERQRLMQETIQTMRTELQQEAAASGETGKRPSPKVSLHLQPEWHLLPEMSTVSVKLSHTDAISWNVLVLKGLATEAPLIELTLQNMEMLLLDGVRNQIRSMVSCSTVTTLTTTVTVYSSTISYRTATE